MCKLFAISVEKKQDLKGFVNSLLVHFGRDNKDGTGISYTEDGEIKTIKSKQQALMFVLNNHYTINTDAAICHVRAKTTGDVADHNSHPFISEDGSIALAHNGILSNYSDYEKELKKTHTFSSEVDSEVMLHAFEDHRENFIKIMKKNKVTGWANVIILEKDGTIYAYSGGNMYSYVVAGKVIILQEKLFDKCKEIKSGHLLKIRNGKILSNKNVGDLTHVYYQNTGYIYHGGGMINDGYWDTSGEYRRWRRWDEDEDDTESQQNENRDNFSLQDASERFSETFDLEYDMVRFKYDGKNYLIRIEDITAEKIKVINTVLSCFSLVKDGVYQGKIQPKKLWAKIEEAEEEVFA